MMTEETYTDRTIETLTLDHFDGTALVSTDGLFSRAPQEVLDILKPGDEYELERCRYSTIGGYRVNGVWYGRKSDQKIQEEEDAHRKEARQKYKKWVDDNWETYGRMKDALPQWALNLLESNRKSSEENGEDFKYAFMGEIYVLAALQLAVLFTEAGSYIQDTWNDEKKLPLPENIKQYCDNFGISGNQYGWARSVAHAHLNGDNFEQKDND